MNGHQQLIIAALLSFCASLLHVAIIIGGGNWYRFFGAGEGMAKLAESGSRYPMMVTSIIACVLAAWGLYALSGAGVIPRLPFLRVALCAITAVYLARGLAGLVLPFVSSHPAIAANSLSFWMVSSAICCIFGLFYLLGTINLWAQLSGNP